MSKLNGVVEVEDLQEATREENFQVGAAYVFLRHLLLGPGHNRQNLCRSAKPEVSLVCMYFRGSTLIVSATEDDQSGDVRRRLSLYEKNGMWIEMQKFDT